MSRIKIDLKRCPQKLQYSIAIAVVVIVATAAWIFGRGNAIPAWIEGYLIPILGLLFLILAIVFVATLIFKRQQ